MIVQNDDGFDLALALDGQAPIMPQWFPFGFRLASAGAVRELYKQMNSDGIKIFKALEPVSQIAGWAPTPSIFDCDASSRGGFHITISIKRRP